MSTEDASQSLGALLDGPAQPITPEPKVQEVSEPAIAETGVKAETSEPPSEASVEAQVPADEGPTVPRKALEDTRRKWQESTKQLEDLQRQFQELQARMQQPPAQLPNEQQQQVQPPDPWTDPEGALRYQQEMFQTELYRTRLFSSEELVRSQKPDYDEIAEIVCQEIPRNAALRHQIFNHPFPAKLVYEAGRKIKALREIGNDPDAYRQRIIDEWRAENQPEQQQPSNAAPSQPPAKISVPKSLAGTPSAQPRAANGRWTGPASLDDLLGG